MPLSEYEPLELQQWQAPFDDDEWIFEIKYDGFRCLAYIEGNDCNLVSRNEFRFNRFANLAQVLPASIDANNAILDGELVCLDPQGKPRFYDLMYNKGTPIFAVFDLLYLDGDDWRDRSLLDRKARLEEIVLDSSCVMYVDHIDEHGIKLFEQMCALDMEGIVAKPKISAYREVRGQSPWIKIKNQNYSQAEGRGAHFNR